MEIHTVGKGAISVYGCLKEAYNKSRTRKIDNFMKYVDARYEVMTPQEKGKLVNYLDSREGQDLLSDYVNNALNTSSDTVVMAYALLYCNDLDFNFSTQDKRSIISSLQGISDDLILLLIELSKLKPTHENEAFRRILITHQVGEEIEHAGNLYVDIAELTRRGLLLPDPKPATFSGAEWSIAFGISPVALQCVRLLEKSSELRKIT
ncbi:hypothetical protein CSB62_25845 [Vibrio splendidus]|uniref:hypothetical protein n=1 Tax=Vibrio splendidus TaxID=29497 RepID=UPI000C083E20|nr:hypothetical protein [Vibrio splendidus]PHN83112.1 hypothetical protein CSB62_25845 [Vibrio splendidus]PTQ03947.1 hypothetical protein CWO33_23895 [Vibrio splendidus]